MLTKEERAAEDAYHQQTAATAWSEIQHIAQRLQPDADVLDIRRAGVVWRGLRRAWHQAGELGTFVDFADAQVAVVEQEAA